MNFKMNFSVVTTEMTAFSSKGDLVTTQSKLTNKIRVPHKLSGGKRLMTFDETYKSEMGVTFKKRI